MKLLIILLGVLALSACQPAKETPASSPDSPANSTEKVLPIKAVVVAMFEIGEDTGDKPGEFQFWRERYGLTEKFEFPHGFHDIYYNPEKGVLGMVTGMGISRASSAFMALGLDPRFDLTKAYWLVAGIAGIDPQDGSIGSAIWADYLVDGDLAHQIDAREVPNDWKTGYFPLFAHAPYPESDEEVVATNGEAFQLNTQLVDWAYALTKDMTLMDTDAMQALRSKYTEMPAAQQPPTVLRGDHLSASTFWHGKLLNDWANDWTSYWTNGKGNFMTSGMEDTGSYQSMVFLDNAGLVDKERFLVLRTASNFTMQPASLTAAENLKAESSGAGYAGMRPALEAAYKVGSKVVDEIVLNWTEYQEALPHQ
ncbi:MAG: purine nucleoside permease [Alteromonadaceae bacterium]|nr:purine nucleoside permease [Alteromonadaceae bacterium]